MSISRGVVLPDPSFPFLHAVVIIVVGGVVVGVLVIIVVGGVVAFVVVVAKEFLIFSIYNLYTHFVGGHKCIGMLKTIKPSKLYHTTKRI